MINNYTFRRVFLYYMSILKKIFGDPNEKIIKAMEPIVKEINELEKKYEKMSDSDLKKMTDDFRRKFGVGKEELGIRNKELGIEEQKNTNSKFKIQNSKLDQILPEAFAVVREAAKRTLGQRHYDVQLMGGIVLHRGQITEMKTGEGKTLVATLAAYLNALTGQGVHVITVNDYLARRDAGWMGAIYYSLGLSTGVIVHETAYIYDPSVNLEEEKDEKLKHFRKVERREAYEADITYGTNNEFGFDYLRDNMAPSLNRCAQRELNYTIVDEIDSILIDEARTPLIISAPAEESTDKYYKFSQLVQRLKENDSSTSSGQGDYNIDEKMRAATLTEAGIAKMEKWLNVDNIYVSGGVREVHHIEQALKASVLFKRDKDYVVKEGQIIIVDEFTGRLMPGRRYSEGLHQAIEAKEGVAVQRESQTLASITFQNYFRLYNKLSGMTGTAVTEAEEFSKIYNLETVIVPTNKPMIRRDLNDLIYRAETGKFQAVIEDAKERNKKGQPVLIGTISIEKNELLVQMMEREGLHPQVLNAKNHIKEAQIIAQAGKVGTITIATNMAGRGVDIVLGGSPMSKEEQEKVINLGGLHIVGTERHESRRIDNQLRGRAGRQGDPGSSQFYISTDDDLMRIFGGDRMKNLMATLRVPEDMPIENRIVSKSIESAQKKVEGNNFDIRKHLVEYDDVINKHREAIYRKRKQILLISEFEKEKKNSDKLDSQITNYKLQITNKSQNSNDKNSKHNDEIKTGKENKKNEYGRDSSATSQDDKDSIASLQNDSGLTDIILKMVENEIEQVVSFHTSAENIKDWNIEEIEQVAATIFPITNKLKTDLSEIAGENGKLDKVKVRTKIIEHLVKLAKDNYEEMKVKSKEAGFNWLEIEKAVLIRSIDTLWIEHIEAMAHMRQGIGLRGYGQKDPLVEYKKEAYGLYNELNNLIQKQVVYSIFKVADIGQFRAPDLTQRAKHYSAPAKTMDTGTGSFSGFKKMATGSNSSTARNKEQGTRNKENTIREKVKDKSGKKVGRNDLCPCGSGKKFKKCCGV